MVRVVRLSLQPPRRSHPEGERHPGVAQPGKHPTGTSATVAAPSAKRS